MSEDRNELDRSKKEWLNQRMEAVCQKWPYTHRFEYNSLYDFWRASYFGQIRKMIRDYESLKGNLDLDRRYSLEIDGYYIYVRQASLFSKDQYTTKLASTPMESPLDPEAIWRIRDENEDLKWSCGTSATRFKSHVITCYERAAMERLKHFYAEKLEPQGYAVQVFSKGRGRDIEYALMMTHNTETPDACVDYLKNEGFVPYMLAKDKAKVKRKPAAGSDKEALSVREAELLAELEAIRKMMKS